MVSPDVAVIVLSVFLVLAMGAALTLVLVALRSAARVPLLVAAALVVAALLVVAVLPVDVPLPVGLVLAVLGAALAVIGGDPATRRILETATHGRVVEGDNGGILLRAPTLPGQAAGTGAVREVLRGGTTIGYLERIGIALGLIAGFPEAVAVVVALKGIGRFSELAAPEARERFLIGTLASIVWAGVVAALVRLAIW